MEKKLTCDEVYNSYCKWCKTRNIIPCSASEFEKEVKDVFGIDPTVEVIDGVSKRIYKDLKDIRYRYN